MPLDPGGQKAQTGHAEAGTQLGVNYSVQCLTSLDYMMPAYTVNRIERQRQVLGSAASRDSI